MDDGPRFPAVPLATGPDDCFAPAAHASGAARSVPARGWLRIAAQSLRTPVAATRPRTPRGGSDGLPDPCESRRPR
jgi:hypothetical protein